MSNAGVVNVTEPDLDVRIRDAVRSVWGFDTLRPLQSQAISAGLAHQDSLVVLPTGGGKSLCYQVPPLVSGRMDIVISPLIALMRDQVDGLRQNGYPAAAVHSNLTPAERDDIREGVRARRFRLLFVSPERIVQPEFLDFLDRMDIRSFAIDEAHCISQWGHDFRPEYRQLVILKKRFPKASVHAYTATATQRVRDDIVERLALVNPNVLVGIFDRPNLTYRVLPAMDVQLQTLEAIRRHEKQAVIVYCLSRKDTEYMAAFLKANGVNAAHYHAGMQGPERSRVQDAFSAEKLDVVCATVAFGMGIDRSDVRCIVHACMPKSVEHYQQETGRAGRDGLEAECVLFYSIGDVIRWEKLIKKSAENAEQPQLVIAASRELLNHMASFCTRVRCRHKMLSEYFGQSYDKPNCQACDACLQEIETLPDSTKIAQKILSCVYRMDQRWGIGSIVEVLRGANTAQVQQRRHDQLSTFGILREFSDKVLAQLIYQLVDAELLERTEGERPVIRLTSQAMRVLRGEEEVRFVKPVVSLKESRQAEESWEGVDHGLYEALRTLRRTLAEERRVPAFVIFGDAVLRDMARRRPSTLRALRDIGGVGERKLADLGETFIAAITSYCRDHGVDMDVGASAVHEASVIVRPRRTDPRPNNQKTQAIELLRQGLDVREVAAMTGRAEGTVWNYLSEMVIQDPALDIHRWVDDATCQRVLQAATGLEGLSMKPVFEALNQEVPYGVIRMVIAHAEALSQREPSGA